MLFRESKSKSAGEVKISVVISLKNEEENVPSLVKSLTEQDYSKDNYEVIFVDDNSSDNTFQILNNLTSDYKNFSVISANSKSLPGKKGALSIGIEKATNPFILITDADCVIENNWIKSFSGKFSEGYDFVFGIINIFQSDSLVNNIACFENLRTSILTFGLAGIGLPYSCGGASFGFSRKAFEKTGGYKNTIETLSGDDDLLIREAVINKTRVGIVTGRNSFVHTHSPVSFAAYLKQKTRHTTTSNHYLLRHKITLTFWHLMNLLFLVSPVFSFISPHFCWMFLSKIIIDVLIVLLFGKNFGYKFSLLWIIPLQILYEVLLVRNYFSATFQKQIEWK